MKYDDKRGSSAKRGYNSRWQKARATYLMRNPLCVTCEKQGITKAAAVVDHIVAHKGSTSVFWDTSNWQGLCGHCHNSNKQRYELGSIQEVGIDGWPVGKE